MRDTCVQATITRETLSVEWTASDINKRKRGNADAETPGEPGQVSQGAWLSRSPHLGGPLGAHWGALTYLQGHAASSVQLLAWSLLPLNEGSGEQESQGWVLIPGLLASRVPPYRLVPQALWAPTQLQAVSQNYLAPVTCTQKSLLQETTLAQQARERLHREGWAARRALQELRNYRGQSSESLLKAHLQGWAASIQMLLAAYKLLKPIHQSEAAIWIYSHTYKHLAPPPSTAPASRPEPPSPRSH